MRKISKALAATLALSTSLAPTAVLASSANEAATVVEKIRIGVF